LTKYIKKWGEKKEGEGEEKISVVID